jgi:hypothetical protein
MNGFCVAHSVIHAFVVHHTAPRRGELLRKVMNYHSVGVMSGRVRFVTDKKNTVGVGVTYYLPIPRIGIQVMPWVRFPHGVSFCETFCTLLWLEGACAITSVRLDLVHFAATMALHLHWHIRL